VSAPSSRSSSRWVAVGRVGRSHGLDGYFVVEAASDDPERFAEGAIVYVNREPAKVVGAKQAGGRLAIRLDRAAPRSSAIEVPASELPALADGSYYAFELIGLAVEEEGGEQLGRVQDVVAGVANDVLELESGVALPMVGECIRSIDLVSGRIVVARGFVEER
jgi:16S rRNA processing protein RimM